MDILDCLAYGVELTEYMAAHSSVFLALVCALTVAQGFLHWLLRRRRPGAAFLVSVLVPLPLLFAYVELELAHASGVWVWNRMLAGAGVIGIFSGAFAALLLRLLWDLHPSRRKVRSEASGGGPPP